MFSPSPGSPDNVSVTPKQLYGPVKAGVPDTSPLRPQRGKRPGVAYQTAVNGDPGLSVGLVHEKELIGNGAFGRADPAAGKAAAPDTLFAFLRGQLRQSQLR